MNWRVISWLGMLLYAGRGWASEPPIPYDGAGHILFRRGAPCGVKVEIYLDLACSDCEAAWPTMAQAAKEFDRGAEFTFRLFPLPYHKNAFTAAQAAQVVKLYSDEDDDVVESFVDLVFEGQEKILNSATTDMTQTEIQDIFAAWAAIAGGVTAEEFASGMADDALDQNARHQFKYGCLHNIYGTPIVYVGGVLADSLSSGSATITSWRDLLAPIVPENLVNRKKYRRRDGAIVSVPWTSTEVAPCGHT